MTDNRSPQIQLSVEEAWQAVGKLANELRQTLQRMSVFKQNQLQRFQKSGSPAAQQRIMGLRQTLEKCNKNIGIVNKMLALTQPQEDPSAVREWLHACQHYWERGDWQTGLFFRAANERWQTLEQQVQGSLVGLLQAAAAAESRQKVQPKRSKNATMPIYIYLYQADGHNIRVWQQAIFSLSNQSVNRPIYKNEADVKQLIDSRSDPHNHAYVIVLIDENDVVQASRGKPRQDKYGHELLTLSERAIKLENIDQIVHITGRYRFENGALKQDSSA